MVDIVYTEVIRCLNKVFDYSDILYNTVVTDSNASGTPLIGHMVRHYTGQGIELVKAG